MTLSVKYCLLKIVLSCVFGCVSLMFSVFCKCQYLALENAVCACYEDASHDAVGKKEISAEKISENNSRRTKVDRPSMRPRGRSA
jgi:hypothetical protein